LNESRFNKQDVLQKARDVFRTEADGLAGLMDRLDDDFFLVVEKIVATSGRVIVTGIGKSGLIGQKIASTLSSTGTIAAFLHPTESFHGDLGILLPQDIVLMISNSGETTEIINLVPRVKDIGCVVVAVTGRRESTLARSADFTLDIGFEKEADPFNLIPTTSAVNTLAMGDALTVVLMILRGFDLEQYALNHPGGSIGKKLTLKVGDLFNLNEGNPVVGEAATFAEALEQLTRYNLGAVSITDAEGKLLGIITDGDVRRRFINATGDVSELRAQPVRQLMVKDPKCVTPDDLAVKALKLCQRHQIGELPVVDGEKKVLGMLRLKDLFGAGLG
jgi:arabinose-5-phosphate isomerase